VGGCGRRDSQGDDCERGAFCCASEDGLSLVVKLLLGGVIVVACVVFIKLFASRQTGFNSKLGAYEKVGA
jgi:hypothetical protein